MPSDTVNQKLNSLWAVVEPMLHRSKVSEAHGAFTACANALANPQPETPSLQEAAEEVDSESTKLLGDLVEAIDTYGDSRMQYWPETVKAVNHLHRIALSQTPGGAQKEIRGERTCPDCKGTGVRNANHGMCRSCNGYGKFQDPPPTAPEESEPVSDEVVGSRGGDVLAEKGWKPIHSAPVGEVLEFGWDEGAACDLTTDSELGMLNIKGHISYVNGADPDLPTHWRDPRRDTNPPKKSPENLDQSAEAQEDLDGGAVHNAIRFTETALLKADDELRNGGTHRDAFAILNAAMNQLRTRLIAAAQNEAKVAANPSPSQSGGERLREAAVDVLRRLAANSDARSDLTKRENDAIIAGRGTEDFADEWLALRDEAKELAQESRDLLSALSQTPGGAQPIPEAKSHDYPLFDLDRALGIVERVEAFVGGDIDPELASVSTVLADLDNLSLCLKLAAGEVEDPPPTATAESEPASESVDSSRGGDGPYGDGPYTEGQLFQALGVDMFLEGQEAAIANAAYAEGYKAAQNEAMVREEMSEEGGWQPIETAPKDELLLVGYRGGSASSTGFARLFEGGWFSDTNIRRPDPTHWMPRPAPPSEGSKS